MFGSLYHERRHQLDIESGFDLANGRQVLVPVEEVLHRQRLASRQDLFQEHLLTRRHSGGEPRHEGVERCELRLIASSCRPAAR